MAAEEPAIVRRIGWRLLPFLVLLYTVAYVDRSTLGFAKLQMAGDIGLGDAAYGFGAGLFFIAYFLCEVPSNLLLVRVGARRWFARILVSWGAVTMASALIQTPTHFYVARFLLGMTEAGFYPGVLFYLSRWFPQRYLGRVFGLFILAQPIALIVTGPLSGWLLTLDGLGGLRGWQWLFILTGLPAVLLAWPTLRLLPDTPGEARWLGEDERRWLDGELAGRKDVMAAAHHPLQTLRDPRVILLALAFLPFPFAVYGLTLWLPTILAGYGGDPVTTGLLFALPYIAAVIALLTVPRRSDRKDERYGHIAACVLLAVIGLVVAASAASLPVQLAGLCLAAFGFYGGQTVLWTLPTRFLAGPAAATGVALINSIANLGGYAGPQAVGLVKQWSGRSADGLYVLAGSMLLTLAMLALLKPRLTEPPLTSASR